MNKNMPEKYNLFDEIEMKRNDEIDNDDDDY